MYPPSIFVPQSGHFRVLFTVSCRSPPIDKLSDRRPTGRVERGRSVRIAAEQRAEKRGACSSPASGSVMQLSSCPQPYNPKQQEADRYRNVCNPIKATVPTIERPGTDRPETAVPIKRQSSNEKKKDANNARSDCTAIQSGDIRRLQSCHNRQ
jgi:hypothetical protein